MTTTRSSRRATSHAYKDGAAWTLASAFPAAADDVEAGTGGVYAFKNAVEYDIDVMRIGTLPSGDTTKLELCRGTIPVGPDPGHDNLPG
jgi:hypothetical protein